MQSFTFSQCKCCSTCESAQFLIVRQAQQNYLTPTTFPAKSNYYLDMKAFEQFIKTLACAYNNCRDEREIGAG